MRLSLLRHHRAAQRANLLAANDSPPASHDCYIAGFFHIDGKHDWLPLNLNDYYENRRAKVPAVTKKM